MAFYGADVLNYGSRHSYSFHSFRTFHRPDGSSFGLFSLADWYFAFLLYPDAIGKEPVSYTHLDVYKRQDQVISQRWLGAGPYRVWQNRIHGTQYAVWENDYNDPIPGETFTYPEFKGYFGSVSWMNIRTKEGTISLTNETPDAYIGVYQPRDGRDRLLYTLPESGISVLNVIPPVRNKVNSTDLCGPSSQPKWVNGPQSGRIIFRFME